MRKRLLIYLGITLLLPVFASAQVSCPNLTHTLARGSRGIDVTSVQQFLISQHLLASDSATGFFGALTEGAVKKFQCAQNIVCSGTPASTGWGVVGVRTRAAISKVCGTPAGMPVSSSSDSSSLKSCVFNGQAVSTGSSVTAYQAATASYGNQCVAETRTCSNGTMSGSYAYTSCTVQSTQSCTFNGQTIANGSSVTAYQSQTVSAGSQCVNQSRTCTNGVLSGSYQYASCVVATKVISQTTNCVDSSLSKITGWSATIYGDGVISGMAWDAADPQKPLSINFYVDNGGDTSYLKDTNPNATIETPTPIATVIANGNNYQEFWDHGASPMHNFVFKIPEQYRDNKTHRIYAQPIGLDCKVKQSVTAVPNGTQWTYAPLPFTLKPTTVENSYVTDAHCLSSDSKCATVADDFLAPNYSASTGWSDNVNYFKTWGCTSSSGVNNIARLNIIPFGSHGPNFQKDSVYWAPTDDPIIYFVAVRGNNSNSSVWSLKKTSYDALFGSWKIYDMLDYRTNAGGISSLDGHYPDFIATDWSIPGWRPVALHSGTQTKIPGVSTTPSNAEIGVYPLVGTGPLGLTTIGEFVQGAAVRMGGPGGRECMMNDAKLFDYDSSGVPRSLIVGLWKAANTATGNAPCTLPPGAPLAQLPSVGMYIFRYQGASGWQLDLNAGPVLNEATILKPTWANQHHFLTGDWNGRIKMVNTDETLGSNTHVVLDCSATGANQNFKHVVNFAEPTGNENHFIFMANPPDKTTDGDGTLTGVSVVDIYYAFNDGGGN